MSEWPNYTLCPLCGFGFFTDNPARVLDHDKHCDRVQHGYLLVENPEDCLVGQGNGDTVLESSLKQSYAYRQRFAEAALVQQEEFDFPTSYDGSESDEEYDGRAYAYCRNRRVIGFAVLRRRSPSLQSAWLMPSGFGKGPVPSSSIPRWTVDRVWVHRASRRTGIAARLVAEIARHLETSLAELAYLPEFTSDGEALVRALSPGSVWTA